MSTMAAPPQSTSTSRRPVVTWRDALTPTNRASRRRWTACYALLLILAAVGVAADLFALESNAGNEVPLILFVALPVVFGMLRRGTRRIAALDHPDLDERDIEARNSAYRIAFPLFAFVVAAAFALLVVAAPDTTREDASGAVIDGWYLAPSALLGLGVWLALWAIFLPTGVLAWREPDALDDDTAGNRLTEPLRDALLGLALAVGIVASLIVSSAVWALAFVATIALCGGLARRSEGQPMMSRQRKWRVAIGLVLILALVAAIGLADSSRGGVESGPDEPDKTRVR